MRAETIGINDSYKGVPVESKGVPVENSIPAYGGVPVPKERLIGVRKPKATQIETIPAVITTTGKKCKR